MLREQQIELSQQEKDALRKLQIGHNVASVLNHPAEEENQSWFGQFSSFFDRDEPQPTVVAAVLAPVEKTDFEPYFATYEEQMKRFLNNHPNDKQNNTVRLTAQQITSRRRDSLVDMQRKLGTDDEELAACFKMVPKKYFEAECELTFEEENKNSHAAYLFHEELSGWLDQVEICIWGQTTSQADNFFNNLSDLRHLNNEVKDATTSVSQVRGKLNAVKQTIVQNHLKVLQLKRRQKNVDTLQNLIQHIRDVRTVLDTVDNLISSSQEFTQALSLIKHTRQVLKSNLEGVQCLRSLSRRLNNYEEIIVDQLRKKFISHALTWQPSEDDDSSDELAQKMLPIIQGLLYSQGDNIHQVMVYYRTQVVQDIKDCTVNAISQSLAELQVAGGDDENREQYVGTVGAGHIRKLDASAFLSFLELVFSSVETALARVAHVHMVIRTTLPEMVKESESTTLTEKMVQNLIEESEAIVSNVCDIAQRSVVQLFKVRTESTEKLSLQDFKQLYASVGNFSMKMEGHSSPSSSLELRGALRLQAKGFITQLHESCTIKMNAFLDEEQWKNIDVPIEVQAACKRIVTGTISINTDDHRALLVGDGNGKSQLVIMNKPFRTVSATLYLLQYIEQYLACARHLMLAMVAMPLLLELLRMFNERTNKLVLKADATRTAGLKQISTRNLALASQALSTVLVLIPSVKSCLVDSLVQKSKHYDKDVRRVELEMEQLTMEYETHRKQIFTKFTHMLESLLVSNDCCGQNLQTIDWDARSTGQMGKPQDYMVTLTSGILKMHSLLQKYLPGNQLALVFRDIFDMFNRKIPEIFSKVKPETATGRSKVRIDINHLISFLRRLRGTEGLGDSLENYVVENFGSSTVTTKSDFTNGDEQDASSSPATPPKEVEQDASPSNQEESLQDSSNSGNDIG